MKTRHFYREGDWLVIPLEENGYALGIIARTNNKSAYLLGYFFPTKYSSPPSAETAASLTQRDSVLIAWFSNLGIKNGEWLILHNSKSFLREEWPVPKFGRPDLIHPEIGYLIEYDQEEPISSRPVQEVICDASQLVGLPVDEKYGHLALAQKLSLITT
ncbi:MAG: immunity 26/phosphotriesterase HocA family protein [Caldilineaceae bacterium]